MVMQMETPMAGLRAKQKEQRRVAIADAAMKLFVEKGFDKTRMEDIAAEVNVSGQTVFNYYPTKQVILFEFLKLADRSALEEARSTLDPTGDPVDVLCGLVEIITRLELRIMAPSLWREILPIILFNPKDELPESYRRENDNLIADIRAFLHDMQKAGRLSARADIDFAAFMLNDYGHLQLVRLVNRDDPDWDAFRDNVRNSIRLMVQGLICPPEA